MNTHFLIIGAVLLLLAYLIGVKKQTWLLSGFNQRRVKDQNKLAKLLGFYNLVMGLVLISAAFIDSRLTDFVLPALLIGYVLLLGYVNTKLVA
ncbi:DUF3784 domain-containing protein [Bacillus tianshenii]|uniref:DUF3784 domain-containing protein n=1 Tax=Sutcliffiella tianshenii TaxID=1463404 RepID=UPI001CD57E9A|nr:DUF3784 domain-containing protein [Bacillus tianshenii]MCA1322372.1 DUF3784 domain-containing protein [Bacillus tianshenii]